MTEPIKILIVDDDKNICELIRLYMKKEKYETVITHDGESALSLFAQENPHLVILDLMLPKVDGLSVCREIRKAGNTPVIMLTAKGETFDKVLGLELGADDYIVKPFDAKELAARVKAVLRRTYLPAETTEKKLSFDGLTINLSTYELTVEGKTMEIPPKELELLYYLASHPNRVFTREQLLEAVWDFNYFGDSRTVDVHIKRLREKLPSDNPAWSLDTVWGVGYKFKVTSPKGD